MSLMDEWIEKKRCFIIQPLREDINKISQTQRTSMILLTWNFRKDKFIDTESIILLLEAEKREEWRVIF